MGTFIGFIVIIACCLIFYRAFYEDQYGEPQCKPHSHQPNIVDRLNAARVAESVIRDMDETRQYFKDIKDDLNRQLYAQYIISPEWRMKAELRKAIDKHTCQICGPTTKSTVLDVHHLHYRTLTNEDIDKDLVTLCRNCHGLLHSSMDLETMEYYIQLNRIR